MQKGKSEIDKMKKNVTRKRKKMSKEKLEKDKKNRSCIQKCLGIEAKKNVSCINLVGMFLIFLMGGLSGNGTVI